MFSSISGPGHSAPLHRPQSSRPRQEVAISAEPPAAEVRRTSLFHPATSHEFRRELEPITRRLPAGLLQAFVDQGYCLHVIDSTGLHPLTLEVLDFDLRRLEGPEPAVLLSPVDDGGAGTREELEEWLYYVQALNPELDLNGSAQSDILLPAYRYWFGRRLPAETVAFLRAPRLLMEEPLPQENSEIAAMVTHGWLPGLACEANRILFWDFPIRRQDPLLDWYLLHELGHTTDYSLAFCFPDLWRDWLGRLEECFAQPRPWLTCYSSTSPHEYFAEGFAAWATPARTPFRGMPTSSLAAERLACDQDKLLETDPWLAELIEEAVFALATRS